MVWIGSSPQIPFFTLRISARTLWKRDVRTQSRCIYNRCVYNVLAHLPGLGHAATLWVFFLNLIVNKLIDLRWLHVEVFRSCNGSPSFELHSDVGYPLSNRTEIHASGDYPILLHACWFVAPFDSGDISRAIGCVHLLNIKPSRAPKSSCACSQMAVCVELCNTIAWHIQRQRSLTFACVVCSTWASLTRPIWHLSANVLHDQLTISGIIESPGPTAPDVVPQIPVKKRHIVVGFIVRICRPNLYRKV